MIGMLGDADAESAIAAACALGRLGRVEARVPLKRYLRERPSGRVVEALAGVADDEAVVLLARLGRSRRELADSIVSALEDIDHPRAESAASALKSYMAKNGAPSS